MLPLPDVLRAFAGTRNKVNRWVAAGYLTNKVPEGSPGVPSILDRPTALEIAFMTVLTDAGRNPSDAKIIAGGWLEKIKKGERLQTVVLNHFGGAGQNIPTSSDEPLSVFLDASRLPAEMPMGTEPRPALAIVAVNVTEIIRRVDIIDRSYKVAD